MRYRGRFSLREPKASFRINSDSREYFRLIAFGIDKIGSPIMPIFRSVFKQSFGRISRLVEDELVNFIAVPVNFIDRGSKPESHCPYVGDIFFFIQQAE